MISDIIADGQSRTPPWEIIDMLPGKVVGSAGRQVSLPDWHNSDLKKQAPDLTKKIHASRSAAADLGHALACGYARGSGTGLAVAGPGSLPGPRRGSDAGPFWRDVISRGPGVQAC